MKLTIKKINIQIEFIMNFRNTTTKSAFLPIQYTSLFSYNHLDLFVRMSLQFITTTQYGNYNCILEPDCSYIRAINEPQLENRRVRT